MTASTPVPSTEGRRYRFSVIRILICGIFLSVLVAACMYVRHTAFDFYHARLLENGSKSIAWFVEQIGYALPWILICIFHGIVYMKHGRRDGICQREMFWEILVVILLTYGVLLPCMAALSDSMHEAALEVGADIPQTDGKHDITLIMKLHEWFIRLSIPLAILLVFHGNRARREIRFPETEDEEPTMTKAEYDALRRAAMAVEAEALSKETIEENDGSAASDESISLDMALADESLPPETPVQEVTDHE